MEDICKHPTTIPHHDQVSHHLFNGVDGCLVPRLLPHTYLDTVHGYLSFPTTSIMKRTIILLTSYGTASWPFVYSSKAAGCQRISILAIFCRQFSSQVSHRSSAAFPNVGAQNLPPFMFVQSRGTGSGSCVQRMFPEFFSDDTLEGFRGWGGGRYSPRKQLFGISFFCGRVFFISHLIYIVV